MKFTAKQYQPIEIICRFVVVASRSTEVKSQVLPNQKHTTMCASSCKYAIPTSVQCSKMAGAVKRGSCGGGCGSRTHPASARDVHGIMAALMIHNSAALPLPSFMLMYSVRLDFYEAG
jgi:hypothetical protein